MKKRHQRYIMYVKEHSILRVHVNHSKSLLKHHRASDSSPRTHDDIIIMWSAFHFMYNIMWNKTANDGRGERDEVERVIEIERVWVRCREMNTFGLPLHTKRAPTTHLERQFFLHPSFTPSFSRYRLLSCDSIANGIRSDLWCQKTRCTHTEYHRRHGTL